MVDAALSQLLAELHGLLVGRHPLLRGHLLPHLLVPVDEQYVAHVSSPRSAPGARPEAGAAGGRGTRWPRAPGRRPKRPRTGRRKSRGGRTTTRPPSARATCPG